MHMDGQRFRGQDHQVLLLRDADAGVFKACALHHQGLFLPELSLQGAPHSHRIPGRKFYFQPYLFTPQADPSGNDLVMLHFGKPSFAFFLSYLISPVCTRTNSPTR